MTRSTIQLGSHGPDVSFWQTILHLPADGIFGPATARETRKWQANNHLVTDGIVGPKTWKIVESMFKGDGIDDFGASLDATARPVAKPSDLNAYEVTKRAAPDMPEAYRQYVLAVARGEGFYGLGWKAGEGAGSHNWGAVQGQGPAGSFQHLDHHADGTPYNTAFKAYHNDDEGFLDMARILLKDNVKAALDKKSLRKAVFAQHDNRYFELDPEKYLSAVLRNYQTLTDSSVFDPLLSEKGLSIIGSVVGFLLLAGAGIIGYKRFHG